MPDMQGGAIGGAEPFDRIAVDITFLRMDHAPDTALPVLEAGYALHYVPQPTVGFYRYLYNSVGGEYCWWLRRIEDDASLHAMLQSQANFVFVLYGQGEPAGFFELDLRHHPDCNLSYFGLLPHMVGRNMGGVLLRLAIAAAWSMKPRGVTVNTCTADHPRALPAYLTAGFQPVRQAREVWDIPKRLGLPIPDRLRVSS